MSDPHKMHSLTMSSFTMSSGDSSYSPKVFGRPGNRYSSYTATPGTYNDQNIDHCKRIIIIIPPMFHTAIIIAGTFCLKCDQELCQLAVWLWIAGVSFSG